MEFGENLRNFRKSNKMSQEVLAEKIGVSRQSVSKWEVGSAYPEMSNIMALCTIFHCDITDLINENVSDVDNFDSETKEDIVKFKENQQKNMKRISKTIYIISNIVKIVIGIPTVCILLASIIFPFIAGNLKIEENQIRFFNKEISYSIDENNMMTLDGEKHYINTSTNLSEFVKEHNDVFFRISIEYILICVTILASLAFFTLHYLYKLYKNIYNGDTPFTIENERIVKKAVMFLVIELILTKLTALIYSLIVNLDLVIEFNIKDIIMLLIEISVVYIFKYGRMIQADSKAKIYGKTEE